MSAIKAIENFITRNGEQTGEDRIFVFDTPIECDYFNILSVIKGDKDLEYVVDSEGCYFRYILDEYYAFVILKHLSKIDKYEDEVKFTMPCIDYNEFDYKTFRTSIRNLKLAVGYIERLVDMEKPLNNEEWTIPAIALNVLMNDVQSYNKFIEEKK